MIKISPSILSSDFANLEKELSAIADAGADLPGAANAAGGVDLYDLHAAASQKKRYGKTFKFPPPYALIKKYARKNKTITCLPNTAICFHRSLRHSMTWGKSSGMKMM